MPQQDSYSTSQASQATGVSKQALRAYSSKYRQWLSPDATPEPGKERKFTSDDLRLLRFVFVHTKTEKEPHATVQARLAAGELNNFTWTPDEPQEGSEGAPETSGTSRTSTGALVPMAQVQALQVLLEDARRREQAALDREQAMQTRVVELERALGEAQGALRERPQRKRPAWLRALIGE